MVIIYGLGIHAKRKISERCIPHGEIEAVIDKSSICVGGG